MNVEYVQSPKRRRAPRFPVHVPVEVVSPRGELRAWSVNLSLTGVYCLMEKPARELERVIIRMALPITMPDTRRVEKQLVEIEATVLRTEETGDRQAAAFLFDKVPLEAEWVVGRYLLESFDGQTVSSIRRSEV